MTIEFTMPKFGLTMSEGNVVRWLKNEGEIVEANESVVEIETDKITVEIQVSVSGHLQKILTPAGHGDSGWRQDGADRASLTAS